MHFNIGVTDLLLVEEGAEAKLQQNSGTAVLVHDIFVLVLHCFYSLGFYGQIFW